MERRLVTERGSVKGEERLFTNQDLRKLILPLMAELGLNLVVGMMDTMMVSGVGEAAVSGVSLVDSVMQLLIYIFAAMASGGAVVAGQYLGGRREREAKQAAGDLVWFNLLLGFFIMAAVFAGSRLILTLLFGAISGEVSFHARRYLLMVALSIPAIALYEACAAVFRTMNNAKITMEAAVIMNLINGFGDALFIYGFQMGTRGAALATVLSRWTAALILLILLLNEKLPLALERRFSHRFDCDIPRVCHL